MQSPVTPFTDDFSLDLPTFERLLDFHVRTGATAISWPHHKGESLSLTIAERKLLAEAAVRVVNGRIPVTIHVSALAVEDTMELARHAQKIGADGILAITPYFWTPSLPAIEAYFVRLCSAIELPVLSYNSPSYLAGVEITGALMSRLIERLPNFAGVKEASFNSEKFLEISRAALSSRPDFALLTGVEYLLPERCTGEVAVDFGSGRHIRQSESRLAIAPTIVTELEECPVPDYRPAYYSTKLILSERQRFLGNAGGGTAAGSCANVEAVAGVKGIVANVFEG